jgi:hypothetical protein
MRQKLIIVALFALILFGFQIAVLCAEDSAEEWEPSSAGTLTTWTAPLCSKNQLAVQPFYFYTYTRGTFDDDGNTNSLSDGESKFQHLEQALIMYGITDRWEIDAQPVYQQTYLKKDGEKVSSEGMGDSYLFSRYCFIEENGWLPHVTGIFQLKLPTGKFQKGAEDKDGIDLSGTGSYDHGYGIIVTKKLKPFIFHADAIYSFPLSVKVDGLKTQYGRYINYDFGMEYFLPKGFNLMLEFNGFHQGDMKQAGDFVPASHSSSFGLGAGIGWSCGKIQTLLAYQRTLLGANVDANDSIAVTFVYSF